VTSTKTTRFAEGVAVWVSVRAVEAVTVADLARVAGRYLTPPTVVVLRPPKAGPR